MELTRREINSAMLRWKEALNRFNWVDPAEHLLVDAVIYEYNAALARYQAMLKEGKRKYEQLDVEWEKEPEESEDSGELATVPEELYSEKD